MDGLGDVDIWQDKDTPVGWQELFKEVRHGDSKVQGVRSAERSGLPLPELP